MEQNDQPKKCIDCELFIKPGNPRCYFHRCRFNQTKLCSDCLINFRYKDRSRCRECHNKIKATRNRHRYATDVDYRIRIRQNINDWRKQHPRGPKTEEEKRRQRVKYASDPVYRAQLRLKQIVWRYNLSLEEAELLIDNGCAVCGIIDDLTVDHDHNCCPGNRSCGKCVRGALCSKHNRALANINEDPKIALALIDYIHTNCNG